LRALDRERDVRRGNRPFTIPHECGGKVPAKSGAKRPRGGLPFRL
jgi:hypothetical protein